MSNNLVLASNFSMPAIDYAGQGNAVLGIRDAGKTYTAIKAAEELLDNKIPIICYDPVGVWKNLKVGTGKHKGYPIVVAGGEGADIRLTENNAVDIVRAAMKENVSLVIDLYSPELINKSKWIRIVQETVDLLMYENKDCGLRHIFIEEAAEFIPQRLQNQHFKVYASLERLARMGRNARLGYTLINQRAEEVNKAILEISAMSLLHKQVGKNSLKSIQTWLELLQVDNAKEIIQSLPGLGQGECWVIGMNTKPHKIKITGRKTFHPDPKKNVSAGEVSKMKVDVSSFVEKLNKQLQKPEEKKPAKTVVDTIGNTTQLEKISSMFATYKKETDELVKKQKSVIEEQQATIQRLVKEQNAIRKILGSDASVSVPELPKIETALPKIDTSFQKSVQNFQKPVKVTSPSNGSLGKCPTAILQFLASFPDRSWTKPQVGIATGYSPGSGGFNNALSELNSKGLIVREGGKLQLNPSNQDLWNHVGHDFRPQQYSIHTFKDKLGKCEREIYEVLLEHPRQCFSKQELAEQTPSNYSPGSGGFNNALSTLNTLELIKRSNGQVQLNPELLEI